METYMELRKTCLVVAMIFITVEADTASLSVNTTVEAQVVNSTSFQGTETTSQLSPEISRPAVSTSAAVTKSLINQSSWEARPTSSAISSSPQDTFTSQQVPTVSYLITATLQQPNETSQQTLLRASQPTQSTVLPRATGTIQQAMNTSQASKTLQLPNQSLPQTRQPSASEYIPIKPSDVTRSVQRTTTTFQLVSRNSSVISTGFNESAKSTTFHVTPSLQASHTRITDASPKRHSTISTQGNLTSHTDVVTLTSRSGEVRNFTSSSFHGHSSTFLPTEGVAGVSPSITLNVAASSSRKLRPRPSVDKVTRSTVNSFTAATSSVVVTGPPVPTHPSLTPTTDDATTAAQGNWVTRNTVTFLIIIVCVLFLAVDIILVVKLYKVTRRRRKGKLMINDTLGLDESQGEATLMAVITNNATEASEASEENLQKTFLTFQTEADVTTNETASPDEQDSGLDASEAVRQSQHVGDVEHKANTATREEDKSVEDGKSEKEKNVEGDKKEEMNVEDEKKDEQSLEDVKPEEADNNENGKKEEAENVKDVKPEEAEINENGKKEEAENVKDVKPEEAENNEDGKKEEDLKSVVEDGKPIEEEKNVKDEEEEEDEEEDERDDVKDEKKEDEMKVETGKIKEENSVEDGKKEDRKFIIDDAKQSEENTVDDAKKEEEKTNATGKKREENKAVEDAKQEKEETVQNEKRNNKQAESSV